MCLISNSARTCCVSGLAAIGVKATVKALEKDQAPGPRGWGGQPPIGRCLAYQGLGGLCLRSCAHGAWLGKSNSVVAMSCHVLEVEGKFRIFGCKRSSK